MTPGVIRETAVWSWLDRTGFGHAAFLLLVHPDPAVGDWLARSLRLAKPRRRLPEIGDRVTVLSAERAALRFDGATHLMQVPVGEHWSRFLLLGGPMAVIVGMAPLAREAEPKEVGAYLARASAADRLRMGISRLP